MNFQKTALFVFSKCIVPGARHVWWAWLLWFVAIGKMEILAHLQDDIKVIRRYEGWYYTKLVIYMMILYFETDWSRIRPLPSTTLIKALLACNNLFATPIIML